MCVYKHSTTATVKTGADLLEAIQIENRVADQLTRPVEGDESTSVGMVDLRTECAEAVQVRRRVRFMADPSGVDRRVLTQQQSVSRTTTVPIHVDLLQLQSLLVGNQAQADHLHHRSAALHREL